ncbi:MAG: hypothetical protein N2040_08945 [Caldimonas manganoxidans]|uniref:hypothetical protein n=1 Tax=Caldimonas taiwanensis TaxID=307483 RepID=UPI00078494D6|nr:hypothetical protein [Caldimonas taiwanensis]MCX7660660.1 hypothetical protein [Caldimonas manganoxidans]
MSTDDFFAAPPFKPEAALMQLKRSLRELRPLVERGEHFELQGLTVLQLSALGDHLQVRIVKQPARSPEWETRQLSNAAQVRHFLDEVKRRLARWSEE